MSVKVVLFDLENNVPNAQLFRKVLEHYSTIYLFSCAKKIEYALDDLTEMAAWITSGQVVVLDTAQASQKEFEYAMVVGQLMALLETDTHVELISAMNSSEILLSMLQESQISSHIIQVEDQKSQKSAFKATIPDMEKIVNSPDLLLVKKYCDALAKMTGKPNSVDKLKNSIANILQLQVDDVQKMVGMLISLKIIKKYTEQIEFRKKLLKQWQQLDLKKMDQKENKKVYDSIHQSLHLFEQNTENLSKTEEGVDSLFKNFAQIDPVQMEVIKKLNSLNSEKPKDIYALRDLLEQMFPQSDVRLLLKELIEKGYIYWNGHEILYSHEMFLN